MNNELLEYWEPNAPFFEERMQSLVYAEHYGFSTSVSIEPMLDSENVVALFQTLKPYVTNSIWIGKLNKIDSRIEIKNEKDKEQVNKIISGQTDEKILAIWEQLKNEPLVKWKESFKEVLGLKLADEKGLDI